MHAIKDFFKSHIGKILLYMGCVLALALSIWLVRGTVTVVRDRYDLGQQHEVFLMYLEKSYGTAQYDMDFDKFEAVRAHVSFLYSLRQWIWLLLPLGLAFLSLCLTGLCRGAGRRPRQEGLFTGPFSLWPLELILLLFAAGTVLLAQAIHYGSGGFFDPIVTPRMPYRLAGILLLPALIFHLAGRVKQKNLVQNSLFVRLLHILPLCWKGLLFGLLLGGVVIGLLFLCLNHVPGLLPLYSILGLLFLLLTAFFVYVALGMSRLQKGAAALAEGNLGSRISLQGLLHDFRIHGENLNRVGEGLETALAERMKAERSKAELITNVSHDIRTPLTSLISYAELLEKEESANPRVGEYAAVIRRQSRRLERLTEDLVEATQAASGALPVELAPCDAAVLLSQAMGEYEDRFLKAELTPLLRLPETPLMIRADGRRMWSIFDNLLGNICKYAQPGTRVYGELRREGPEAVFSFKNTSREPLPEQVEELAARFVRGDASRHTEGSGLGLSIADSLARLQGGTLTISADGDLFKAELRFKAQS